MNRTRKIFQAGVLSCSLAVLLSACGSVAPVEMAAINTKTKFSKEKYGVTASPRVTVSKSVKRGGGRFHVGKPYKVAGKWYHPKLDPNYAKVGIASWYGPNFHGRLTANGEIFDQMALSAAHPTLPLPSYVRVTNQENGRSVLVRVNDRGPFAHGRIIDLSKRTAQVLGVIQNGTAKVKVKYIGSARIDGQDDWLAQTFVQSPQKSIYDQDRKVVARMSGQGPKFGSSLLTGSVPSEVVSILGTSFGEVPLPQARPLPTSSNLKSGVEMPAPVSDPRKPKLINSDATQAYSSVQMGLGEDHIFDALTGYSNSAYFAGGYSDLEDAQLVAARLKDYADVEIVVKGGPEPIFQVHVSQIPTKAHMDAIVAKTSVLNR